ARRALRDPRLDLGPEMTDKPLDRPGRRIAEGADRMALDLARHLLQHVDLLDPRIAAHEALHHPIHPAGALAAGGALAAALMHVEMREAGDGLDGIGALVHDDDRGRA